MKQYLSDLLTLSQTLQDPAMQCAVLKQIQTMATYFACFPKLVKALNKCLIEKWACGECRVQVLAFLSLRKLVLLQSHPALHALLKVHKACSCVQAVGPISTMINNLIETVHLFL